MGAIWAVEPPPDSRLAKAGAIRKDRVGPGDGLDVRRSGRPMGGTVAWTGPGIVGRAAWFAGVSRCRGPPRDHLRLWVRGEM